VSRGRVRARRDWADLLAELARQIDDGRIYDRDLLGLSDALGAVLVAYRRSYVRSGSIEYQRQAGARQQAAGLRLGEAAAVRVSDIDVLRRTLTVARQVQRITGGGLGNPYKPLT
jgi:integrase